MKRLLIALLCACFIAHNHAALEVINAVKKLDASSTDLSELKKAIHDGGNVDETDARGITPLMWAAIKGNKQAAELLINEQADINAQNQKKETALMLAAKNKHKDVVAFLLEKKAKIDLQDADEDTALTLAVKLGAQLDVINALINANANLNLQNEAGNTALMEAVLADRADVVQALVKAKAALDKTNHAGDTALAIAQKRANLGIKNQDIIALLQQPTPAPSPAQAPRNIIEAAQAGNLKAVQAFIAQKVDLNIQNKWGTTALSIAAQNGFLPVVQALIAAGADINLADGKGNSPLMVAVLQNRVAVVKELVKHGALDLPNKQGKTPLLVVQELVKKDRGYGKSQNALQNAHLDLIAVSRSGNLIDVQKYIAAKINLNGVDDKGQTALIAATIANQESVVSALLGAGARADILDSVKKSALYYAVDAGYENLIMLLAPRSATIINVPSNNVTILATAKKRGRSPAIIALLQSAGAR